MIVEAEHIALKDEMKFGTRKYRAPYGVEQVEMKLEEKELDAAGSLYVALSEYKKLDTATPHLCQQAPLEIEETTPLRIGSKTHLREGGLSQRKERVWMKLSERREKKWRGETHQTKLQLKGTSLRMSYCKT